MASTAAALAVPAAAQAAPKAKPDVPVQLIAMNDFHGRIELTPTNSSGTGEAQQITAPGPDGAYGTGDDVVSIVGGSANVASTVNRLQSQFRAQYGHKAGSWFVAAGDLISGSPFASAVFKDEPTIEVLNAMGLDASSVGNHEFDRGTQELRRISGATDGTFTDNVTACQGVTVGVTGCFDDSTGAAFHGTDFPYLAANVVSKRTGKPMLPPYQVFNIPGGQKVALIGVVTDDTPNIVDAAGVADVRFLDEADAVNKYVPELRRRGVEAIGVLIHEGGQQDGPQKANPNGCDTLTGPIVDINNRISDAVDLIVSAHTHQAYNCLLPVPGGQARLVTSAGYYGRLVSDIRLTLDGRTGDVKRQATYRATNVPVTRDNPDAGVQSIVDYWVAKSAVAGNRHVGEATADIVNSASSQRAFEQPIGNLVAQAQLEALQEETYGFPTIALMNPGGVRANIGAGEITYKEVFDVQPFGNYTGAMTLTGADLDDLLEQQYQQDPDGPGGPLDAGPRGTRLTFGTNAGFTWSYDLSQMYGNRVPDDSIKVGGVTINPAGTYRVAVNSFLAAGQDGFTTFRNGTAYTTGPVDVDALEDYIAAHSPVSPPPANHGTQIG
jgi:5'-nucleotidase